MLLHCVNFKIALSRLARSSKISRRVYTYDANYSRIGAFLQKYGTNLNKTAFDGKLDPLVGRTKEVERAIQILGKRTKNNPILIGEPGVGKTAIVEGIALRIVTGNIPEFMAGKVIISLDIASMLAGAKLRGEFEERFKSVLRDVERADGTVMLFIDEIHMIVGAGASDGNSFDAGNMLKPALARGELRCLGATTTDEYKKYIEKDAALARRFQSIHVPEPTVDEAVEILKGLKQKYESHHKVLISDTAIEASCSMSHRYITNRRLPDKAIDLIDEACSQTKIKLGISAKERQKKDEQQKSQEIEANKNLVPDATGNSSMSVAAESTTILTSDVEVGSNEKSNPVYVRPEVDENSVADIISRITRMPVGKLLDSEAKSLLRIEDQLRERIIGQDHVLEAIASVIRLARAGLRHHNRPIGVFLFLGRTGTGKTEVAKALSEVIFNAADSMTRVDMNEYSERISVSRLVGSPAGYVGYEEGGILSEAVRNRPYQVVLLDEFEKADRAVTNMLLQVFDEGSLSDAQGRFIDFKNTIIVLTANIGVGNKTDEAIIDSEKIDKDAVKLLVERYLSPELVNRMDDILVFKQITKDGIEKIRDIQLRKVDELLLKRGIKCEISTKLKLLLSDKSYSDSSGARPLKRLIQNTVLDPIATAVLDGTLLPPCSVFIDSRSKSTDEEELSMNGFVKAKVSDHLIIYSKNERPVVAVE